MKIVVQNFKTGKLSVADAPRPAVPKNGILVRTTASLISAGTDRTSLELANKSYLGKALARPDLVRRVIRKLLNDGLSSTYKAVQNVISEPRTLGYSLAGEVLGVGAGVEGVAVGDRVACAGAGHANHAGVVAIPGNLFVPLPDGVSDEDAAYVTLGAIAMHGVRQADQQFGATVLVVGLGLVGQITLQLCRAAGFKVIGLDLDDAKLELARKQGALIAAKPDDAALAADLKAATDGFGVDAVLLTAGSRDSGAPFAMVAGHCRDRAKIVVVGDVKMDISRDVYFKKELEVLQSRSYGPGRYDPDYEEKGRDYPIGYVRWTERRNMAAFLEMAAAGQLDMKALTTHRFPIEQAADAYELVTGAKSEFTVGMLLTFGMGASEHSAPPAAAKLKSAVKDGGKVGLGIIGAGNFAKSVLVPALTGTGGFDVRGVVSARGIAADTMKENTGAAYSGSEANAVLDDADVDAVVIATRHDSHATYVIDALNAGKHVFVEKPLCLTRDELAKIEAAARESKGILMVGFNRRFSPYVQAARDHFDGRKEPLAMIYRINAGRIELDSPSAWVHDPQSGGGRIIGEACHFIDTMQTITGARPVDLHATGLNPGRADLSAADVVTMTIGFDDGSMGTVHYFANGATGLSKERLEIFGQEKIAVIDDWRSLDLIDGNNSKHQSSQTMQKGFAEEAQAFLEGCRTGIAPIPAASLIDTTLVTLLAVEDLAGTWDETLDLGD
ncbi:MAG TPA: bi-domain-containing oxidoreductase [Rhodospirillales bacterium]|jgi:predicted dehydrogenase/threonine dehydrogenase-like Zn-dependent dehydrogenase|nr:bi-domain-containing oxidoreductase [Rhodospirillales bacterium]